MFLGYRVTVCDARPLFATERRFPDAHEVVVEWPHRYLARSVAAGAVNARTVICVLTHDQKFDVPCSKSPCAPTPATSAPWAAVAPTPSVSSGCANAA